MPEDWVLTPINGKAAYRTGWASETPLAREVIEREIRSGRAAGYGLRTGTISGGLLCIDFDGPSTHPKLMELSGGRELPPTVSYTSGRNGREQRLFKVPPEFWGMIATRKIPAGLDEKGNTELVEIRWNDLQSGMVPSYHPMTGRYDFIENCAPWEIEVAKATDWLVDLVRKDKQPPVPVEGVLLSDKLPYLLARLVRIFECISEF